MIHSIGCIIGVRAETACAPAREPHDGRSVTGHGRESAAAGAVFSLHSESFADGDPIPERFALDHGVSPHLAWYDAPRAADRFVILMDDPDAQRVVGHTFVHWVACVPARVTSLPLGASSGGWTSYPKVLAGDCTSTAYRGPKPPPGSGMHRYFIKIYAVAHSFSDPEFKNLARSRRANDTRTHTRAYFEERYGADVLASAEISGTYPAHAPGSH